MQVFFKFSEHGRIAYPIGIYICHKLLRPKLKPPRNSKSGTAIVATVAIIIYKSRATRNPYGRKTGTSTLAKLANKSTLSIGF